MSETGGSTTVIPLMAMTAPPAIGSAWPTILFARETLSEPFQFNIEFLCAGKDLDASLILHQPACVTLQTASGSIRHFHGVVRTLTAMGIGDMTQYRYALELVPRLWFLSLTQDCRVFQDKTTREIMSTLFTEAGIQDIDFRLYDPPVAREYTVQMNETDLDFVSRLLREEGWFYFFEHTADKHTLVVTSGNKAFVEIANASMTVAPALKSGGDLTRWRPVDQATLGRSIRMDYDPIKPNADLQASQNTVLQVSGASQRDMFRWPALSYDRGVVTDRAKYEMEAAEVRAALVEGIGGHGGFIAGGTFALTSDPQTGAHDQVWALCQVVHQAGQPGQRSGNGQSTYFNSFVAFPKSKQWRDPMLQRPLMAGVYSATVIGPDADEIHTDQYGRVKVLFPWDRRQDSTAGASVWLRVIQPWAGPGWGVQFLPRVNTEVAVAFFDGDIDRPVVIGGIYNGKDKPVFTLPAQKNKSGLRTRSTLKGGADNFSELSFDDTKGSELVFFQAEKDHTVNIKHNDKQTIGADQTIVIGSGQHTTIASDPKAAESGNTYTLDVGNGDALTTIDKGNYSVIAKQGITVDSTDSDILVQADKGNITTDAQKGDITIKADLGNITTSAKQTLAESGLKITLDGQTSIELTVGPNSIKIDQSGVTISGLMISIKGSIKAEMDSPMTKVSGDGMLTLFGAITKIN